MRAAAWCVLEPEEHPLPLTPGDLIGRAHHAALRIDDARISEAHAMVSLRGGALWLLALRGRLYVRGRLLGEVPLQPGTRVELADGCALRCDAVSLPEHVLGLRLDAGPPQVLAGPCSVLPGPPPVLRPGLHAGAACVLWTVGLDWRLQVHGGPPGPLLPGDRIQVGSATLEAVLVPCEHAGHTRTQPALRGAITWIPLGQAVRMEPDGGGPVEIAGISGRILSALLTEPEPLEWLQLCMRVWPDDRSALESLRNRLDVNVTRLRDRLREVGATDVRLAMDGRGRTLLHLPEHDRIALDASAA